MSKNKDHPNVRTWLARHSSGTKVPLIDPIDTYSRPRQLLVRGRRTIARAGRAAGRTLRSFRFPPVEIIMFAAMIIGVAGGFVHLQNHMFETMQDMKAAAELHQLDRDRLEQKALLTGEQEKQVTLSKELSAGPSVSVTDVSSSTGRSWQDRLGTDFEYGLIYRFEIESESDASLAREAATKMTVDEPDHIQRHDDSLYVVPNR